MYRPLYRHLLLPVCDRVIKGRRTLKYWADAERSQWWSTERHREMQCEALGNLLRHAWESCPYYRETWQELGLNPSRLHSLDDFHAWPTMTRETIRTHRLEMRTRLAGSLMSKSTGGSSGEPLQFDLNSDSNDRRTAQMYRGYGWAGGEPGTKQLYVWGGPLSTVGKWKRLKMQVHSRIERHRVINCFEFTPDRMRGHFDTLNSYRAEVIVAYTNPLYEFARYLDDNRLVPTPPRSIIVGAEKLHSFQRNLLEKVFQAPVYETYGSREFMLIGAECNRHTGLHLSQENLLVEILDDDGRPTPAGEEGNVVITDLFNYGMPFIRYVNGDRAIAGFKKCTCGRGLPLLTQVTGRRLDTLDTPDGRKVPGEFFPHLMKEFPAIRRFQVVQESLDQIRLNLVAPELAEGDRHRLLNAIRETTGTAVQLNLQLVPDIPLTGAGKLKVVVRNN